MSIRLAKGTKEIIPVEVIDDAGVYTDLSPYSPKFDFLDDSDVFIYNQQAVTTVNGMILNCLLDTSATGPSGLLPVGHYRLFVSWTTAIEKPREGPIDVFLKDKSS